MCCEFYPESALRPGTIVSGVKHHYRITDCLRADGQGFLYTAEICLEQTAEHGEDVREMVLREQFMPRCSRRGDDGQAVVTDAELAPTVEDCLNVFRRACDERYEISRDMPYIINVEECFDANNTYYYAVDKLQGCTLTEYVKRHGPMKVDEAADLLAPVLSAAEHIHAFHTMHADITPDHIRLERNADGTLRPVLFHLYRSIHFNESGFPIWSVPYLTCHDGYAPLEQYGIIDHFTPQTDVYSLAAIIVFMITGSPLPPAKEVNEKVVRELLPPALPAQFVNALVSALQPSVENRTSTVATLREGLRTYFKFRRFISDDNDPITTWVTTKANMLKVILGSILAVSAVILAILLL